MRFLRLDIADDWDMLRQRSKYGAQMADQPNWTRDSAGSNAAKV